MEDLQASSLLQFFPQKQYITTTYQRYVSPTRVAVHLQFRIDELSCYIEETRVHIYLRSAFYVSQWHIFLEVQQLYK